MKPTMKRSVITLAAALIAAAALAASVQCRGTTKRGARCKNKTTDASGYCHLHKSQAYRHASAAATNGTRRAHGVAATNSLPR
ncbi:MAG TPA: DUF5763 domain-containing protein [Kiritimatiellia bacterium]|nr:DUF5763 domain-containing protein [Kiritimatiellia bacterium]HOR98653.1 DUF5763 domain-containing protein [Kiritimatiellia bacterium]HRU18922.1 DUF5763 domain-containing protein [Kiritimatiellia bacterium]